MVSLSASVNLPFHHKVQKGCKTVVMAVWSVCLSLAAFPHYCMDPDVTFGNGRGAP